jgi:UDP-glucose 4-epimerase
MPVSRSAAVDLRGTRVLITGGAGLIGSHIADALVGEGVREIVVLDNLVRGRVDNLAWASAHGAVTFVAGDIRDRRVVHEVMKDIDVVFHQAAIRITQCAEEPRLAMEVLGDGAFNVFEAAADANVRKVVAASSASIYGLAEQFPTPESHHPYGNRTLNEGLLRSFHDMYGMHYVALRYFNVYGPRMDVHGAYTEVLIRWMERIAAGQPPIIMGDGEQTMDFVYVRDIARANILAAAAPVSDDALNVASGVETSLNDLARTLLDAMGSPLIPEHAPARRVNPVARRLADTARARSSIGFEAGYTLHDGLEQLIEWWQRQPRQTHAA